MKVLSLVTLASVSLAVPFSVDNGFRARLRLAGTGPHVQCLGYDECMQSSP